MVQEIKNRGGSIFGELLEVGLNENMGIFFFLFVALGALFFMVVRWVVQQNKEREDMAAQREREHVHLIKELSSSLQHIEELRKENRQAHERQESMLGRVLDRLPPRERSDNL